MSLTGTTFLGLVLAATVTAFAVVVWRWGAVAGPDPRWLGGWRGGPD